jgi:signal transduction histidine kinase
MQPLRASAPNAPPEAADAFRTTLYEALLYGLGRTLTRYDPASVRVLVREMGRRIREYLEESGYYLKGGTTPMEVVASISAFFEAHGFVHLEVLRHDTASLHARWHDLLGLRAYERLAAAHGDAFISCPLNAIIDDALAEFGKEIVVHRKHFDISRRLIESWEEIVDRGPEQASRHPLALDVDRVLELEHEQSRQLRLRDDFIRIASHELATPLTSMKLALQRLSGAALPENAERAVAVLNRQYDRIERLASAMLDTTRFQIGRLQLRRTPVDLVEIVHEAVEAFRPSHDTTLGPSIHIGGVSSLIGEWDGPRLDQVVTNLLTNALRYGEGRDIEVEVAAADGHARLTVRDHGIGIPREALGRIFLPFERAVPVERYGGLGLGLYIAYCIVEMHGGTIRVESELGQGATFIVELPLAPPSAGDLNVIEPGPRS